MGWQQTLIIGNVRRDATLKYTQQGIAVCDFSVAVTKVTGKGDDRKEKTTWFKVTIWRERAETVAQYVKKGMQVMVVGDVDASAYTNKDGNPTASLEITSSNVQFRGSKPDGAAAETEPESQEASSEIPF